MLAQLMTWIKKKLPQEPERRSKELKQEITETGDKEVRRFRSFFSTGILLDLLVS
jgi:hypothetical protein